jgi:hypothetical protein
MKDLKQISQNLNNAMTTEKQNIVIDDFAKSVINQVFDQLAKIFPAWQHNWKTQREIDVAKMQWTKAFVENNISTTEQIKHGFSAARKADSDFLPSCGKFISWCNPSPESLGYPSNEKALRLCISYRANSKLFKNAYARPLIVELCKRIDWWLMNAATNQEGQKKAESHFNSVYAELLANGYVEPKESSSERLPTQETINTGMSEQQLQDKKKRAFNHIEQIKKKLKQNKYGE